MSQCRLSCHQNLVSLITLLPTIPAAKQPLHNAITAAAAAACVRCGYAALAASMPLAVNRHADQHLGGCACAAATCAHLCPCRRCGMPNAAAEAVAAFFLDMVHAARRLLTRPLLSTGMLGSACRSRNPCVSNAIAGAVAAFFADLVHAPNRHVKHSV